VTNRRSVEQWAGAFSLAQCGMFPEVHVRAQLSPLARPLTKLSAIVHHNKWSARIVEIGRMRPAWRFRLTPDNDCDRKLVAVAKGQLTSPYPEEQSQRALRLPAQSLLRRSDFPASSSTLIFRPNVAFGLKSTFPGIGPCPLLPQACCRTNMSGRWRATASDRPAGRYYGAGCWLSRHLDLTLDRRKRGHAFQPGMAW